VAKIKILVVIVQKNVVVIDADGLAKTRLVAHTWRHMRSALARGANTKAAANAPAAAVMIAIARMG
jgi:hypothetical protein